MTVGPSSAPSTGDVQKAKYAAEWEALAADQNPASRSFVVTVVRALSESIKAVHGGKIRALEARVADLEEQVTRP